MTEGTSWIEETIKKFDCTGFVASQDDASNECNICKRQRFQHQLNSPTDAFGTVSFPDGSKARYIRLELYSKPDDVFKLLIEHWKHGKPNFVISIHSDNKDNFEQNNKLKSDLTQKFAEEANTPGIGYLN